MSQLMDDLDDRIALKLDIWVKDSLDLYKMVDIPTRFAVSSIMSTLMVKLVRGAILLRIDPNELEEALREAMQTTYDQMKKEAASERTN